MTEQAGKESAARRWPLVGRRAELAQIGAELEAGRSVVIGGPAGVGKTRLAREALARLGEGAPIEAAFATQAAASIPFGAFASLTPLPTVEAGDQLELFASIAARLRERATEQPLTLAVDDAHLLDPGGAALLLHVVATESTRVLATVRSGEQAQDAITALWKDGHAVRLDLQPLSEDETTEMVEAFLGGRVDHAARRWLFATTEGAPLYVHELVLAARTAGTLRDDGGVWRREGELAASPRLVELLGSRLAGIGEDERQLLDAISLTEPVEVAIAEAIGDPAALDSLERRGLVSVTGDGHAASVRAGHPLYAEIARADVGSRRRRMVLREAAAALDQLGRGRPDDILRMASWRLEAGERVAPEMLVAAARHAHTRLDHKLAARLCQAAIPDGGIEAALGYARAALELGQFAEVEETLAPHEGGPISEVEAAAMLELRGRAFQWGLRDDDAARALLARAEGWRPGPSWRLRVRGMKLAVLYDAGRLRDAVELGRSVIAELPKDAPPVVVLSLGICLLYSGKAAEARELADLALDPGTADVESVGPEQLMFWAATRLYSGAELDAAEELALRLHCEATERGATGMAAACELVLGPVAMQRGRVRTAVRWLGDAVAHLQTANVRGVRTMALCVKATAEGLAGDAEQAAATLAEVEELAARRRVTWVEASVLARARIWATARTDAPEAQRIALEEADANREAILEQAMLLHDGVRVGLPARTALARIEAIAAEAESEWISAIADHVRALAARDGAALVAAGERFAAIGANLLAAEALAQAARTHGSAGDVAAAASAATRSRALAAQCEGARTPALGLADAPGAGLTKREHEVATVAAEHPGATLIVEAKLRMPEPRPEAIARDRLRELLAAEPQGPLTVIRAPAGYGKTTLLAQWLSSDTRSGAWLSLDPLDNDPQRLLAHLLEALDRLLPGKLADAQQALAAGSDGLDTVVPLTASALAADSREPRALVLDDYHAIEAEQCHEIVAALVDAAPPGFRVLIASRAEPQLRIAHRRANGDLTEVGVDELRFDRGECDRLLNGSLGLGLDRDQLELIDERLEGWPAGLSLVASSLPAGRDRGGFLPALTRSRSRVDAYLLEEVLDRVGPRLREFLCRTSILGRLSGPLCAAVLDDRAAHDLLAEVRRSNLFVTVLDAGEAWLRYHHLFAELLQRELHATTPELIPVLHERAATWFAANGLAEEAIEHALAAGDGERAAALLYDHFRQLFAQRRFVTLRRMITRLPADRGELTGFCEMLDTLCTAHEGADLRLVAQRLDALERYRGQPGVEPLIDQMRIFPHYGDVGRAVKDGWAAWERYPDLRIRAELSGQFGMVLWFAGDLDHVHDIAEPLLGEIQMPVARMWGLGALALTAADEGDPDLAERYGRQAVDVTTIDGEPGAQESHFAHVALAEALRLQGRLEEAAEQLAHATRLTSKLLGSLYHAFTLVFEAQLALTRRDRASARAGAAAARAVIDRYHDVGTLTDRLAHVEAALQQRSDDDLQGTEPTAAERRILALLATGLTRQQIAEQLVVSVTTVESHRRRLYRRLGASSREQVIAIAHERGLLEPPNMTR